MKGFILSLSIFLLSKCVKSQLIQDSPININFDSLTSLSVGRDEYQKFFFKPDIHLIQTYSGIDSIYFLSAEGKINVILSYQNGVKVFACGYYENGHKCAETDFNELGIHGVNISYYSNGQKKYYRFFKNGIQVFPEILWYENGNILAIIDKSDLTNMYNSIKWYESGEIESKVIGFDSLISPKSGGPFNEKTFYKNGNLKTNETYNMGLQLYEEYYENGQKGTEGKLEDWPGNQVGKWTCWYKNGKMKREYSFNDSIPNQKEGVWKWWNEKGRLTREEIYENDELKNRDFKKD
jgi:antitoxin component YwqK of YwqJK toxin-antitoxin module